MEGWKFTVALALFLAAFTVDASPLIGGGVRTCEEISCKDTNYERFPDPKQPCGYCCCQDGGEFAKTQLCDKGGLFNPVTKQCEGINMCKCMKANCSDPCFSGWIDYPVANPDDPCGYCICPGNGTAPYPGECDCGRFSADWMRCVPDSNICPCKCQDIVCRGLLNGQDEVRFPNPNDRCGFCCCRPDLPNAIPLDCPFHEMYDKLTDDCVPDPTEMCPPTDPTFPDSSSPRPRTTPNGGGGGGGGGGSGGCESVRCPVDPNTAPLYACPNDPHSFCQCDWGEHAHTMPCGPGTTFNFKMQACL